MFEIPYIIASDPRSITPKLAPVNTPALYIILINSMCTFIQGFNVQNI